jgi:hypothetical protein
MSHNQNRLNLKIIKKRLILFLKKKLKFSIPTYQVSPLIISPYSLLISSAALIHGDSSVPNSTFLLLPLFLLL